MMDGEMFCIALESTEPSGLRFASRWMKQACAEGFGSSLEEPASSRTGTAAVGCKRGASSHDSEASPSRDDPINHRIRKINLSQCIARRHSRYAISPPCQEQKNGGENVEGASVPHGSSLQLHCQYNFSKLSIRSEIILRR
jgi:hypothetical protein